MMMDLKSLEFHKEVDKLLAKVNSNPEFKEKMKFKGWYCTNCMQDVIIDQCPTCSRKRYMDETS